MPSTPQWKLSESDLYGLTPLRVRDLMVDCFIEAQRDTFSKAGHVLHQDTEDSEVSGTISTVVRMKFSDLGLSWDQPTPSCLRKVADELAREARAYGTPDDVIAYHHSEITRAIDHLPT